MVRKVPDNAALAMALIENIQREDLNPLEEAIGIQRLIDEFQMTHQAAADAVGRSRSAASNLLRLLKLPQAVQDMLMEGRWTWVMRARCCRWKARSRLLRQQDRVGRAVGARSREAGAGHAESRSRKHKKAHISRDIAQLQEKMADQLGAKVTIQARRKRRRQAGDRI